MIFKAPFQPKLFNDSIFISFSEDTGQILLPPPPPLHHHTSDYNQLGCWITPDVVQVSDLGSADIGLIPQSQNHRMVGVGRDLCGSSSLHHFNFALPCLYTICPLHPLPCSLAGRSSFSKHMNTTQGLEHHSLCISGISLKEIKRPCGPMTVTSII